MKLTFELFFLELKRTVRFIPRLIISAAVILVFLYAILFIGEKKDEKPDTRVKIGYFSSDKEDNYIPILVNMVNEMESVKSICLIEPVDSVEEIYDGIKNKNLYGGIIFPENYVQNIMRGKDDPATVIVPVGHDNEIFRRLVKVGSDMLISVQAGIYSVAEGKNLSNRELLGINMEYVNFVMGRSSLFKKESWSPYGVLSFTQYYCVMLFTIISVLIGTVLSFLFYDYGPGFKSYCKLWQYNGIIMFLLKQFLIFAIIFTVEVPLLIFADKKIPFINLNIPMILAAIFIASQIITCFYSVFGNNAVLLMTVFLIISGFLSGCFIPLVYLGGTGLDKVCGFIPVYTISQCFSTLYTYNSENINIIPMSAAIYIIALLLGAIKRRARI